jgi:hypothetical protein
MGVVSLILIRFEYDTSKTIYRDCKYPIKQDPSKRKVFVPAVLPNKYDIRLSVTQLILH